MLVLFFMGIGGMIVSPFVRFRSDRLIALISSVSLTLVTIGLDRLAIGPNTLGGRKVALALWLIPIVAIAHVLRNRGKFRVGRR